MKTLIRAAAVSALLLGAAPAPAALADPADAAAFAATTLNLSAHGEVRAAPDMATIDIAVETTGATAAEALRANAARAGAMIAALKKSGIADRDLQTSGLNLSAQYAYEQNQPPKLTGYQATNQVTVTVRDLKSLGGVVDAVVAAGATNVSRIAFGLSNPVGAENNARIAAVKALQDKAALYANATGYHIQRLVSLSEAGGYAPPPPRPMAVMAMRADSGATPVEAGELVVRVDINGMFELAH